MRNIFVIGLDDFNRMELASIRDAESCLVTGLGNVPPNDQLAAVTATDPTADAVWEFYPKRWTLLNTIRTVAAAALMFTLGLMQGGGG